METTMVEASRHEAVAVARADDSTMTELFASIERGDRDTAIALLRDRVGFTEEQAGRAVDRATAMIGRAQAGDDAARIEDAAQAASVASTWLSVAILLSLVAAAMGSLLGARGARRRALPGHYAEVRVTRAHTIPPTPIVE